MSFDSCKRIQVYGNPRRRRLGKPGMLKDRHTKFVCWSHESKVPTKVLESLVNTNTFSTQLSEWTVSSADIGACVRGGVKSWPGSNSLFT